MRHNILIFITVLSFQCMLGQISSKACHSMSNKAMLALESHDVDQALDYFGKNDKRSINQVEMAIKEIDAIKHLTSKKFMDVSSKDYIVNRYVYMSNTGEIFLSINFYYERKSKVISIAQMKVLDKSHFISLEELNKRKAARGSVPPPSSQELN